MLTRILAACLVTAAGFVVLNVAFLFEGKPDPIGALLVAAVVGVASALCIRP